MAQKINFKNDLLKKDKYDTDKSNMFHVSHKIRGK